MDLVTVGSFVSCAPPEVQTEKIMTGLEAIYGEDQSVLVSLRVVFGSHIPDVSRDGFPLWLGDGETIWVRKSTMAEAKWSSDVLTIEKRRFIRVPYSDILLIGAWPQSGEIPKENPN